MYQITSIDILTSIFILLSIVTIIAVAMYRKRNTSPALKGNSVLLAYYLDAYKLTSIPGMVDDTYYTMFISSGKKDASSVTTVVFRVELPFFTSIHLLAVPNRSGATMLDPTGKNSLMEKVDLEGDFNTYFTLYTEKGYQTQARYVLDPSAMEFVVDFCQSHNWEIIGNELYFAQALNTESSDDTTFMSEDIRQFIEEIRPAVEDKERAERGSLFMPYGQDRRDTLLCPVCDTLLKNNIVYFACTNDHGVLLSGASLAKVRNGKIKIEIGSGIHKGTNTIRTCPSCTSKMNRVDYNQTGIIIDSCTRCPYRWLDSNEVTQIASKQYVRA